MSRGIMGKRDRIKKKVEKIFGNKERNTLIKDSFETSLKILNECSDFNPFLKLAVSGVCASLEVIHQKTKNKKDMEQMTEDLATKAKELNNLRNKGNSSEVEHHFEKLARELQSINKKLEEKLDHSAFQRTLQAGHDAQKIQSYCQELQAAYDQCKTQILFKIERDTTKILKTLIMSKLNHSEQAPHDVGQKKIPCTDNTRVTILSDIMEWAQNDSLDAPLGYWMCGMAGTGKSTIAKSLCLMLEEKELLAASFFCSRQIAECREYHHIIPTIAYQLANYSCTFGEILESILEQKPDLASKEPVTQMKELLIKPWEAVIKAKKFESYSPVIVIDALDECEDISEVLKAMVPAIQNRQMMGLKFFFTSRPGKNVSIYLEVGRKTSNFERTQVQNFYLHDVEEALVQDDIEKFLKHQLQNFQNIQITDEQMQSLVRSSGKLFVYAATTVKYITGNSGWEQRRLHKILNLTQAPDHEVQTKTIDSLYSEVLAEGISTSRQTSEEREISLKVVHTVVSAATPVTCNTISHLLGYDVDVHDVQATVDNLNSVLYIDEKDKKVYTFHASFSDYILSAKRSGENHCDQSMHHVLLKDACFRIMNEQLHFNICNLPSSFLLDKEVPDIDKRIDENVPSELEYCCFFWAYHLGKCMVDDGMISMLRKFIQRKMIFWIEVMFLLEKLSLCLDILGTALKVNLDKENKGLLRQLNELVTICELGNIKGRTPHLYLSVVPFFMKEISIFDDFRNLMEVKEGKKILRQLGSWNTPSRICCLDLSPDGTMFVTGLGNGEIIFWDTKSSAPMGDPFQGHMDSVMSVAFSPEGERIVSGSSDNAMRVWNARTGALEGEFQGHSDWINSVAFSPDGERIVSGSRDKTVRVWNARTGAPDGDPFQGHNHDVTSVAFSPDGERIVSGSYDNTLRVWNARTGALEGDPFQGHREWVFSVAFSPDGERIVSGSRDKTLRVWNARTGVPEGDPFQGHSHWVTSVAFSPDGEKIVSGSCDKTVRVWNARTGVPEGDPFQGHREWVRSVAFFPDGERIMSGSDDNTVRVWNARTGAPEGDPFQGHSHWVTSVAFSPDGEKIVSGSYDNTVRVWNARTGAPEGDPFQGHGEWVTSVAFFPDGERIVSGSGDNTVRVWNARTGAPEGDPFQGHSDRVTSVAFSPDGERIVSGSGDTVRVWNARTGAPEGDLFQGHSRFVAFSPDGERIVTVSGDTVRVWNARTGAPEGDPFHCHSISSVAFSPDGERIVSGSDDHTVKVWNAMTGAPEGDPFQGHSDRVTSVAFSPDGERIVSGSYDNTVRVWNARTSALEKDPFQRHSPLVSSVAFSPDRERIVSGSGDNTVRVWNARTGAPEGDPFQGYSRVSSVAFSPDGEMIMSGSDDWTVRGLNIQYGQVNHWTLDDDGWVLFPPNPYKLFWIPHEFSHSLWRSQNTLFISRYGYTRISFDQCVYGEDWVKCYSGCDD
ncbi:WD40 repeat-like protein [Dendrothele bispora CBS 962.96]|uniref:WD40 repeat-like protein n=1 Tax=Dendrothele bispora (strain CBS 962.96) TaxID=1314807 RepID=A0A4S8M5N6_DENBC|nr:WD40 repeat-like protein [Dendrothele bispora CBS 962.96]